MGVDEGNQLVMDGCRTVHTYNYQVCCRNEVKMNCNSIGSINRIG